MTHTTTLNQKDHFELPVRWSTDTYTGRLYIGDFNGDGSDDVYYYYLFEFSQLWLSTGSSFTLTTVVDARDDTYRLIVGDFNGDGLDDLMTDDQAATVFLSSGSFNPSSTFPGTGSFFQSSQKWAPEGLMGAFSWNVGDFNGDGKDDIFRYQEGSSGADMYLSDGTKFVAAGSWTDAWIGDAGWYIGDFNGDGKDDMFRYVYGVSGADMFLSTGSHFEHAGSWTPAGMGQSGWHIGDFNGDGKDDILRYLPGESGGDVWLSTGSAFVHDGSWTPAGHGYGGYGSRSGIGWEIGDFNADGTSDLLRVLPGYGTEVIL